MIALRMNQMKFTTTSQNAHELGANVTGMKMAKKLTNFFLNLEKQRGSQNTLKHLLLMIKNLQSKHIF